MKLRERLSQKRFLAPVFGLLFAFFLCFVNSKSVLAKPLDAPLNTTPLTVLADLEDGTDETDAESESSEESAETGETESESESEKPAETCYDQVKGIGWLVCPTSGVLAEAVDSIYKIIEDLLIVQPMSSDTESPIYTVWQYIRDITNIVFIILIIVVIYSQLTGIGFDNYNIKKILPKLIITAILINLSYLICSALVDVSNVIGASLRSFFENIESGISAEGDALVTWGGLAAVLTGSGAVAGIAISAAGGLGAFIWMLLPTLLAAALSVLVGLVTIAMRQAVVALLVMIAPLAFVCYMLPNTNKWFTKWKDALSAMLVFFPMFSALFGASHLAGWALIAKAQQDGSYPTLILGMAVQVLPLFLCVPMMKMSGSVLGQVSNKLTGLTNSINGRARAAADDRRDTARARKLEEAARSNNYLSGARWAAYLERKRFERAESRAKNEEGMKNTFSLYSNARRTGRRITGWDSHGRAIYAQQAMRDDEGKVMTDENGKALTTDRVKVNRDMIEEYRNREAKLAADADKLKIDNAMGNIEAYLRAANVTENRATLDALSKGQAKNYLDLRTQQSAKARNDRSDQRFYFEQVQKASKLNDKGEVVNQRLYNQLVRAGAGADAFDMSKDKETIRENALTTVTADAYEDYEKARKETTAKYATYFDKQITKNVLHGYNDALRKKSIEAVVAAQDTLAKRGDYDKIEEYLAHFMDHTASKNGEIDFTNQKGYVELGTDFANVLAGDLMGMKDAAPILGRLGKFINMETWRNSNVDKNGNPLRGRSYITMKEYNTGGYDYVNPGDDQTYNVKTSAAALQKGTSLANIDRTGFGAMQQHIERYHHGDEKYFTNFVGNFLPEIISNMPKFETDGEQIMNTLGFMTGMKWSEKTATWEKNNDTQIHMDIIKKYMGGLTDKDVNVLKTNAFQAICSAIAADRGETAYKTTDGSSVIKYDAAGRPTNLVMKDGAPVFEPSQEIKNAFRGMVKQSVLDTLQNNINQGTNGGMKPAIMDALGLTTPKQPKS